MQPLPSNPQDPTEPELAAATAGSAQPTDREILWDVLVVGAGAAGLWAARVAAERGARVLLLEKTPRCGTKVLASGGTRCNLTTTLGPAEAGRLFRTKAERFLRPALRALTPEHVREHFHRWGVPTVEAPLEKIFPASQSAKQVRDALEREARAAGVRIECRQPVVGLRSASDEWQVDSWPAGASQALSWRTQNVMLCPGGASVPKSGTTGDAYAWLRALDLPVTEPVPALVPLRSPEPWVHALTGIAVEQALAKLTSPSGKRLQERLRPVLFTHQGLSGPGAMDLSHWVARAAAGDGEAGPYSVALDLFPEHSQEELRAVLVAAQGAPGRPNLAAALPMPLPRRLLEAVLAQADLPGGMLARGGLGALTKAGRHRLVEALKGLRVAIEGTLGMDKAEVTSGGLALRQVNPRTMEVNGHPGLFVFGELLDLDGPIGGLNFQAAWATAELAGRAVQWASP